MRIKSGHAIKGDGWVYHHPYTVLITCLLWPFFWVLVGFLLFCDKVARW